MGVSSLIEKKRSIMRELKDSFETIGPLYPVLLDREGNVIDGEHRSSIENWPKVKLENIKSEKDRLIVRVISNNQRRSVTAREKSKLLCHLARILANEGTEKGKIGYKIAKTTGMSYQWVMKYLSEHYKDDKQSGRAKRSYGARLSARYDSIKNSLREPPGDAISISYYKNTDFVNVLVKKNIYQRLVEEAKKMDIDIDKLIYNALILRHFFD